MSFGLNTTKGYCNSVSLGSWVNSYNIINFTFTLIFILLMIVQLIPKRRKIFSITNIVITTICLLINSLLMIPNSLSIIKISYHIVLTKLCMDVNVAILDQIYFEVESKRKKLYNVGFESNILIKKILIILFKFLLSIYFYANIYFIINTLAYDYDPKFLTIYYLINSILNMGLIFYSRIEFESIYNGDNINLIFLINYSILFPISNIIEIIFLNLCQNHQFFFPMITIINFIRIFGVNYVISCIMFLHSTFEKYYLESINFDSVGFNFLNYVLYLFPILYFKEDENQSLNYDFM